MGEVLLLICQPRVEGGLALGWVCVCRIIMGRYEYVYVIGFPRVSSHPAVFGRAPCGEAPCAVAQVKKPTLDLHTLG